MDIAIMNIVVQRAEYLAGHSEPASVQTTQEARADEIEAEHGSLGSESKVFRGTIGLL